MNKLQAPDKQIQITTKGSHDFFVRCKFRGVNPLVQGTDGNFRRLTEIDSLFANDSIQLQAQLVQGWYVKCIDASSVQEGAQRSLTA